MTIKTLCVAASLVVLLSGCGPSMDLSVRNETSHPVRLGLIDVIGSHESAWFTADISAGTEFEYEMKNGWRSDGKLARIMTVDSSAEPVTTRISESGRTKLTVRAGGQELLVEKR